jgi:hypothetical protein
MFVLFKNISRYTSKSGNAFKLYFDQQMNYRFHFILLFIIVTQSLSAQTIVNGGFESWYTPASAFYQNPDDWVTSNDVVGAFGLVNVTSVTSPIQSGLHAAKLESIDILGLSTAPGFVGIVTVDPLDQSQTPGQLFTTRPDSITGYYQYSPVDNDKFLVSGVLTKWNGSYRDTIGIAQFTSGESVSVYKRFSLPFRYLNAGTPDSLTLVISSSEVLNNAIVGSIAYIDNINFVYTNPANDSITDIPVITYPNPCKDRFWIKGLPLNVEITLSDVSGKLILKQIINSANQQINVSHLQNGIYFINGKGISKKILVAR